MAAQKKKMQSTGMGTFVYPWLSKPDFKFDPDGVYKLDIECKRSDPDAMALVETIDEMNVGSKVPYTIDEENDTITFKSKCKAEYPPKLFDAQRTSIKRSPTLSIYGGTIGRAFVKPATYTMQGGGVTLYLSAVQIIDLVEMGQDCPFDEVEGGFTADDMDDFVDSSSDGDAPKDIPADDGDAPKDGCDF